MYPGHRYEIGKVWQSHSLEKAVAEDSIWHLWGHSWEIEKFGMWDALENVLRVASTYQAEAMTNTQLSNHIWKTNL